MIKNETFYAVWQPGTGSQHAHPDLDATKLKSFQSTYAKQGLHLTALDIWISSHVPTRRSYIGVWQAGAVKQYLEPQLSLAEFETKLDAHFKKGRRLAAFDIDDIGLVCAAWQPGSGPERVCVGFTLGDFNDLNKEQYELGRRLILLRRHGPDQFAAVWHPGSGAQWSAAGMSEDEFKGSDRAYFNSGLRLISLDEYKGRFTAVWRPGTGTQWVNWNMYFDELKSLDDQYFADGLRFKVLKRAGTGKASAHK